MSTSPGTGQRWRRRSPGPVVGLVVLLLGVLSWAAWSAGLADGGAVPALLPWWLFVPLFASFEIVVLHVQVRREAQAVSLSEIPLVLALFTVGPVAMFWTNVVGAGVVYLFYRRQSPLKLAFNLALRAFGVTTSLVVFHGLIGPDASAAMNPSGWLAAILAVALAGTFDGLLVLGIVAFHEGAPHRQEVVTAVAAIR